MKEGEFIIKAGSKKMKVGRRGHRTGWHKFSADAVAVCLYQPGIFQTVYIVVDGPDKGRYAT